MLILDVKQKAGIKSLGWKSSIFSKICVGIHTFAIVVNVIFVQFVLHLSALYLCLLCDLNFYMYN